MKATYLKAMFFALSLAGTSGAASLLSSIDSGGGQTTSASYSMDESIGGIGGISSGASLTTTIRYGYIAQLDDYNVSLVTISTNNAAYNHSGGSGSVGVMACGNCAWLATSNDGWITITSGSSGIGNGTVDYLVASSSNCVGRAGTLSIGGQTFTVTQAAGAGSYSIAPTSRSHSATAESGNFTVAAGVGCTWNATSGASWITITGGGPGNGGVNYTVAANFWAARSAAITVQGLSFTVEQGGNILATIGNSPVIVSGAATLFTPAMFGITTNSVSCQWNFGDGQTSMDCEPSHVFSNCGPLDVTAIVSDGLAPVTNSLLVSVTCPFSELPKPTSLKMKSNFAPDKLDTATLKTSVDMPPGFSAPNTSVTLELGGVEVPFTLNAKGQAVNTFSSIKFSRKGTGTLWQVSAKLKGDFDATWQNAGLTNATVSALPIIVPVLLLFNTPAPESFYMEKPLLYKATAGKSGSAK